MHKHGGDIYAHPNVIDFSANINFLGVPEAVMAAARNALNEVVHYPQPGSGELCQAVAELEQVNLEQVICGNGAADVIFSLAVAEKPKKALIPVPTFQEYEQALLSVDCQVEFARFHGVKTYRQEKLKRGAAEQEAAEWNVAERGEAEWEESNGKIPEENFLGKITDDIDMVFFCNPNNPTGTLQEREYMLRLLKKCAQTKTRLVVDECFLDFVSGAEQITMKPFLEQYDNLFIVKAFTKMFAMPGVRLGYGLSSDKKLLEKMQQVTQPWNVSVIAQEMGIAAARETDFIEKTRAAVEEEKQYLLQELQQFPVEIYGSAANFLFFHGEKELDKKLEQYHILIRNCSNFRGLEEGWYRIAVRSHSENQQLVQAFKRIL